MLFVFTDNHPVALRLCQGLVGTDPPELHDHDKPTGPGPRVCVLHLECDPLSSSFRLGWGVSGRFSDFKVWSMI